MNEEHAGVFIARANQKKLRVSKKRTCYSNDHMKVQLNAEILTFFTNTLPTVFTCVSFIEGL